MSEYDQEIPQSQTADNPAAPRGRAAQPKFVFAPAVNAANNVLVMYHTTMLKQELSSDETYENNLLEERSVDDRHQCHMNAKYVVFVDENHGKLHTLYWLPRTLYKSSFIANISSCPTTELFIF